MFLYSGGLAWLKSVPAFLTTKKTQCKQTYENYQGPCVQDYHVIVLNSHSLIVSVSGLKNLEKRIYRKLEFANLDWKHYLLESMSKRNRSTLRSLIEAWVCPLFDFSSHPLLFESTRPSNGSTSLTDLTFLSFFKENFLLKEKGIWMHFKKSEFINNT